jgi:hypothetical protein
MPQIKGLKQGVPKINIQKNQAAYREPNDVKESELPSDHDEDEEGIITAVNNNCLLSSRRRYS